MRLILGFLLVVPCQPALAAGWPGMPPDCWAESRNYHGSEKFAPWKKNTEITPLKAQKPKPGVFSPNKSYFFVSEGLGRSNATITIYAEKDHLIQITFAELFGLSEIRWVNEKLLFMRPWWGRSVGTDLIYDVEKEEIIYAETIRDGYIAYQQFQEDCPQHGCECIRKQ